MASMSTVHATSSSCDGSFPAAQFKYDVFVSFRREDVRKNFVDHLFAALGQKGIFAFKDDYKLDEGKPNHPDLLKAIEESRFAVIVFSKNYASSSWCLDELWKICECIKMTGQVALPVFNDVDPGEVRKQTGNYGKALAAHEQASAEKTEKVKKWKAALTEMAGISGWDLRNRHEATIIKDIVHHIFSNLNASISSICKDLVGIEPRLEEVALLLGMGLDDVQMIGIWGMAGIGKTTLARVIYDKFSYQFEGSTFISNVKGVAEKQGLAPLQEQLLTETLKEKYLNVLDVHRGLNIIKHRLRSKKVLVILDDVNALEQLEKLAGKHEWFGPGSRIIITARDEDLLINHGVDKLYKARELDEQEALQLFCWKAFKQNHPAQDFVELSKRVVDYARGIPSTLEVQGSFLYGRSVNEWKSALKRLM